MFAQICNSGELLSKNRLAAGGQKYSAGCVEVELGTTDSVFFYVAPFRYPRTAFGLLFSATLEQDHARHATATPFDSGGLVSIFSRPVGAESARDFLWRHEIPVPDHRKYLGLLMITLFETPMHYIQGIEPKLPSPIGLTARVPTCDQRIWTHEVRIPNRVLLRNGHLKAVFAAKGRVAADPGIENFFQWCVARDVDTIEFDTARDEAFTAMGSACVNYVQEKLGSKAENE